mgnify:CR=1 FL=1
MKRLLDLVWMLRNRRIPSVVPTYQQAHVQHLANAHKIHVSAICANVYHAAAFIHTRTIIIPEASNDVNYSAALHELGHILDPTQQWAGSRHIHSNEIGAWRWAKEHALWWTPEMEATKRYALSTYGIEDMQDLGMTR